MAKDDFVLIDDPSKISQKLPSSIRRLIGEAIVEFSRLEILAENILRDHLLKLSYEDSQLLLPRMEASRKFQILREIIERRFPDVAELNPKDSIWSAIRTVTEARNMVAHGYWIMYDGEPKILSHRWKGPPGIVVIEPFPYEKLRRVGRLSKNLTEILRNLARALKALPPAPAEQLPEVKQSPA